LELHGCYGDEDEMISKVISARTICSRVNQVLAAQGQRLVMPMYGNRDTPGEVVSATTGEIIKSRVILEALAHSLGVLNADEKITYSKKRNE
jgi:hypothetical protein